MNAQTNAPVDVLAVLDALLPDLAWGTVGRLKGGTEGHAQITQARAAVAVLIAEADTTARILHNVIEAGQVGAGYAGHLEDLRAAIANVGGAP